MQQYAVIVAGGKGTRMGKDVPKQFIELNGLPILANTLLRFSQAMPSIQLIVVLPKDQVAFWQDWVAQLDFAIPHQVVFGGKSRFQSVKNGLNAIDDQAEGIVAIHDGVRPFVLPETIRKSFNIAGDKGNAIVSVVVDKPDAAANLLNERLIAA